MIPQPVPDVLDRRIAHRDVSVEAEAVLSGEPLDLDDHPCKPGM